MGLRTGKMVQRAINHIEYYRETPVGSSSASRRIELCELATIKHKCSVVTEEIRP